MWSGRVRVGKEQKSREKSRYFGKKVKKILTLVTGRVRVEKGKTKKEIAGSRESQR